MGALKKYKKYKQLDRVEDENINALLVYGKNKDTDRGELVCFYRKSKGFEALCNLKSVLTQQQIKTVRGWISEFNPKFEVQLDQSWKK